MKIAFDIGGVLSKYPDILRPLLWLIQNRGCDPAYRITLFVISDMHDKEKMLAMLQVNGFGFIRPENVHSADYKAHGEACKAILCEQLGIDILVDDFPGYVSVPDKPPLRLLVMPDVERPYYATGEKPGDAHWHTDGSEGDFGRRYYPKRPPHDK